MGKYIKDNHIINATEKAYRVIYKEKGYIPYKQVSKATKSTKKKEEASE